MQSTIRSVAAAVMMLVPLGATLVAQPAAAQHQAVYAQPAIRGVTLHSDRGLAPGARLHLQVAATPGARWTSVTLGSSGQRVWLRERTPGNYVGSYVVRRTDRIDPTQRMTVRAGYGARQVAQSFRYPAPFQAQALGNAPAPRHVDRRAPRIFDVTPAHRGVLRDRGRDVRLSARLSDDRSGVDPRSVRLRIDGRDVTRQAQVREDRIRYREDLPRGRHTAELTVRDRAGNASRAVWSFDVV